MSHELYQIGNEYSMAFTGKTPWHGLGQEVEPGISLEDWAKKAHLDWEVVEAPVELVLRRGGYRDSDLNIPIPGKKAFYRSDNFQPLSVVGSKYKPVQPREVLDFFRDLTEEHGFVMETAGSVMDGRRVWALANVGKSFTLPGDDEVRAYLLLATSCDRSMSTTASLTSIRVVCNNTLEFAYQDSDRKDAKAIRIPHAATFKPDKIKLDLMGIESSWAKFKGYAEKMSSSKISKLQAMNFFMDLFHDPKSGDDYADVPPRTIKKVYELFREGVGSSLESANMTLWGVVNAITRLVDHERGRAVDTRLQSAWFGEGRTLKLKAWARACLILDGVDLPEENEE